MGTAPRWLLLAFCDGGGWQACSPKSSSSGAVKEKRSSLLASVLFWLVLWACCVHHMDGLLMDHAWSASLLPDEWPHLYFKSKPSPQQCIQGPSLPPLLPLFWALLWLSPPQPEKRRVSGDAFSHPLLCCHLPMARPLEARWFFSWARLQAATVSLLVMLVFVEHQTSSQEEKRLMSICTFLSACCNCFFVPCVRVSP